jgi:uncharacterized protein HemX
MTLSPAQEEFFREYFDRQREIGKNSLDNVTELAKANIETILTAGLISPPTIEKMEQVLAELKEKKAQEIEALQKDINNGN